MEEQDSRQGIRLAKFMSEAGVAARRKCEEAIVEGRVTVNGHAVLTPAFRVNPETDEVRYEGQLLRPQKKVYLMLYKPDGYTCSAQDGHAEHLVYELIPAEFGRLYTVGRLDRDSEGLLLLTNDGEFAQMLTHPSHEVLKEYLVFCRGDYDDSCRRIMMEGIMDDGEFLQAKAVKAVFGRNGDIRMTVWLGEGRKREVRRLCAAVGLHVRRLIRVAIGDLVLDGLEAGQWRELTAAERQALFRKS